MFGRRAIDTAKLTTCRVTEGLARLLDDKRQALDRESRRFLSSGDPEALHDLRVAMRRLHSLFIAFTPAFKAHVAVAESLHQLQKQTNHARDLEVTLGILRNCRLQLPWLEIQWQRELEEEYARLRALLPGAWSELTPELDNLSELFALEQRHDTLGPFASELLRQREAKLERRRIQVCEKWKNRRAHKLRIAGKQIRYLLEPFSDEVTKAQSAVEKFKTFQDLLGDYHDVIVLRKKLKHLEAVDGIQSAQLKAARKILKKKAKKLRQKCVGKYCHGKGRKLRNVLRKTEHELAKN